jgi:hypothetical protein
VIKIENQKQKDEELCEPVSVRLKPVALAGDDGQTSCVLVASEGDRVDRLWLRLTPQEERAFKVFADLPDGAVHSTEWRKALEAVSGSHVPAKTFNNWRVALQKKGLIEPVPGIRHCYRIRGTDDEDSATAIGQPSTGHDRGPIQAAATATTP